jgi:hypothetical protein
MQEPLSMVIAAALALVGLWPVARGQLRQPLLWACAAAGAITGPIAREGTQLAWDWLGPVGVVSSNPTGSSVYLLITAAIGELVKATAPLAVVSLVRTDAAAAIAYGAAAGAGFSFAATQQVLTLALRLLGSTFITPVSMAVAVVGWLFPVLSHIATTALITRAGVRGGLAVAYLGAWVVQFALGWLPNQLPIVAGVATGTVITAFLAFVLYASLWAIRTRAMAAPRAAP